MANSEGPDRLNGSEIAVIGMACRFPRAGNLDAYWQNLRDGIEAISFLKDEELELSLVDPAEPGNPDYVKAASILEGADLFDASFFGYTPREAEVMDPQHRLFMECGWEALEHAGYDPEAYKGSIGVFAGARTNTYLFNLFSNREKLTSFGAFEIGLGNDLAFLPTRISYKFNLRGPSYAVHTACSTSLVAIHLACQSLLIDECQMVLAGGVAVNVPQKTGYLYMREGITSPDGHCRAFDAKAQGTLFGSGVGIVVLKRLEDALTDGDTIHAVIKGTAANNDGSAKASFTAPSVNGQMEVISEALANACVDPATITYVETHGTGTALGDPIEIRGLTKAFRTKAEAKNFCAIGSVKSNLGHLDAAAGIASFIKAALAIEHKMIPPSLHFEEPNANIDFDNSAFYVNTQLCEWKTNGLPRRAGVSAFGVGGTNAHAVLEEAPPVEDSSESKPWQLLVLSAKTSTALERVTTNLAGYFKQHANAKLADVAYTLQLGRRPFGHRRVVVCGDVGSALRELESLSPQHVFTDFQEASNRPVVFMFPGGGAQYLNMGYDLYKTERVFREQVDQCCELLEPSLGFDLRKLLFPADDQAGEVTEKLRQTSVALPALFVIEYAMAKLWISLAVRPEAMIGHSLGEYVAACLSGVFSLQDALALVVLRGRLFELLPRGAMMSVSLSESEARSMIDDRISVAAINGPSQCVLSGPENLIDEMAAVLAEKEIDARRLHIDVAAHSTMVDSILDSFRGFVEKLDLRGPRIPFLSNVTGGWITEEEATSPSYWTRHLRETVRFADGLRKLMKEPSRVLLEVGPGQTLSTLAKLQQEYNSGRIVLSSMRHPFEQQSDLACMLTVLGKLWLSGVEINWSELYAGEHRHRLPLPTYPFERQRYWIEPEGFAAKAETRRKAVGKRADITEWFHAPSWKRTALPRPAPETPENKSERRWLVFVDEGSLGQQLLERLKGDESNVISVLAGEAFGKLGESEYTIRIGNREDYLKLIGELKAADQAPTDALHLWSITPDSQAETSVESFDRAQDAAFYSLLYLAQALGEHNIVEPLQLWIITNGLHEIESSDQSSPEKATMLGPCKVIPQEQQNVVSHCIDVVVAAPASSLELKLVDHLMREFFAQSPDPIIAYRGGRRWVQTFEPVHLREDHEPVRPLRQNGVYLITGGLGGVGLLLAEYLARTVQARLILTGRSSLPDKNAWDEWLAGHEDDDATSYKIRKAQSLESFGAEVMTASADVASEDQMRGLIQKIHERYGELNGVIHAAGVTSGSSVFTPISEIGPEEAKAQFQPKVIGVYVLEKILRDEKVLRGRAVDFCVMTSSNSSVLGGMGFVTYSAANAFMDAFASSSSKQSSISWISSSWDPWPEETKKYTGVQTSMDKYAMTAEESVEAFRRVMTMADEGHVVVATGDLPERIDLWIRRDFTVDDTPAGVVHPRPGIQSAYVAPSGETEQAIANTWQELLGIEQVGVHDNFFDLGGHSLLATKLVSRLRAEFQTDLPLQKFFEAPTISGLARAITDLQAESEDQQTADVLERIAHLSDEEVEMELSKGLNPR